MDSLAGQGRIKWAAIGAAVAVTLGAGGIGVVRATVSSLNLTAGGGAGVNVGLASVQATWSPVGVGATAASDTPAGSSTGNGD